MTGVERKLSEPMRRHLLELLASGPYWRPENRGEQVCASALERRGLISVSGYHGGRAVYILNEQGRVVAAAMRGRSS